MEVDRDSDNSEHGNDTDNGGYDEEDFDNTFTRPVQVQIDIEVEKIFLIIFCFRTHLT